MDEFILKMVIVKFIVLSIPKKHSLLSRKFFCLRQRNWEKDSFERLEIFRFLPNLGKWLNFFYLVSLSPTLSPTFSQSLSLSLSLSLSCSHSLAFILILFHALSSHSCTHSLLLTLLLSLLHSVLSVRQFFFSLISAILFLSLPPFVSSFFFLSLQKRIVVMIQSLH